MLFFALAFQSFAYLTNFELAELIRNSSDEERDIIRQQAGATSLNDLYFTIEISRAIGFFVGFLFSIIISRMRNWYWVNSAISFFIILLLGFADLLGWSFRKSVFLLPADFLPGKTYYIVIGLVLLAIGIFLFLLRKPIEMKHERRMRKHYVQ